MVKRTWAPALILVIGLGQAGVLLAFAAPFLYKPLPYDRSSSLVVLRPVGEDGWAHDAVTAGVFRRIRQRSDLFDLICGYRSPRQLQVIAGSGRVVLKALAVTSNVLACLGFDRETQSTHLPADERALVLSHSAAVRIFGLDRTAIGRLVRLHGGDCLPVRGVLPEALVLPVRMSADALVIEPDQAWQRSGDNVMAVCRRRGDLTDRQITAALAADPELAEPRVTLRVVGLRSWLGQKGRYLALGSVVTAMLFLVLSVFSACGLVGVKATHGRHLWFVHRALGASSWRLGVGVLREALATAALAAGGSLVVTWVIVRCATALVPFELLQMGRPQLDGATVTGIVALAGLGAFTSYLPSLCLLRSTAIRRDPGEHGSVRALRRVMTVGQSVLAMLLVGVASILLKSQVVMFTQDLGLSLNTTVVSVVYPDDQPAEMAQAGMREALERFRALPGVRAAAAAQGVMFDGAGIDTVVRRHGGSRRVGVRVKSIRGSYVQATGGRLVSGREVAGNTGRLAEVVVNEALAAKLWPGMNASGQSLLVGGRSAPSLVTGVLADAFEAALDERPVPTIYVLADRIAAYLPVHYLVDGRGLAEDAVTKLLSATPGSPAVVGVSTVRERLSETVRDKSFAAVVCAVAAVTALLLAWVGIAIIISHAISRRRRELAIRMAIGASPGRLLLTVSNEVMVCTCLGTTIGTGAAVAATRLARSYVYEAGETYWAFQIGVAVIVLLSVAGICLLKGRRASTIEPARLLQAE